MWAFWCLGAFPISQRNDSCKVTTVHDIMSLWPPLVLGVDVTLELRGAGEEGSLLLWACLSPLFSLLSCPGGLKQHADLCRLSLLSQPGPVPATDTLLFTCSC